MAHLGAECGSIPSLEHRVGLGVGGVFGAQGFPVGGLGGLEGFQGRDEVELQGAAASFTGPLLAQGHEQLGLEGVGQAQHRLVVIEGPLLLFDHDRPGGLLTSP